MSNYRYSADVAEIWPKSFAVNVDIRLTGIWRIKLALWLVSLAGRVLGSEATLSFPDEGGDNGK